MKTSIRTAVVAAVVACATAAAAPAFADALRVGAAKTDITPADLTSLNPMGGGNFSGVHDPIFARALYLEAGANRAAIVSVDLIEVGDMTPLRQRIEREVGVPFNAVMITATHDHSAPRIGEVSPGALAHPGGAESRAYTQAVFDKIIAALKQAKAAAQPARYGLLTGHADVNVNRDLYTAKGWGMGFNPEGPSDKTVWVVKFETPAGRPIAVLFNYAVHNDVTLGAGEITGDLSGVAQKYVEDAMGGDGVALWTMGPAGDQDPRVFPHVGMGGRSKDPAPAYRAMDAQGVMVGAEVVRVANEIRDMTASARLSTDAREVSCPTKPGVNQMADMTKVQAPEVKLRLGLILLDQIAFTSVSGEVVTNIYSHLKKASPLSNTIMITLTNDRVGYIADDAAYDRPIFEVNGSPMARGCAEDAIVGGLVEMIDKNLR
jgi:neutral ceramidase